MDFLWLMSKPFLACVILTGIHAYLGMHILQREVIFVDLSLAQIAALGAAAAFFLGFDMHGVAAYFISLGATLAGAVLLVMVRPPRRSVPQEALVGIIYVVAAALAILVLHEAPEGDEHIRHMLIGNILLVDSAALLKIALLYSIIGAIHWKWRQRFFQISSNRAKAAAEGIQVRLWDLLFYGTFGMVVTSSVEVAGILLVFSFLIIPAVASALFFRSWNARLIFGWMFGMAASAGGLGISYAADLPTGAAVVTVFGLLLAVAAVFRKLLKMR